MLNRGQEFSSIFILINTVPLSVIQKNMKLWVSILKRHNKQYHLHILHLFKYFHSAAGWIAEERMLMAS